MSNFDIKIKWTPRDIEAKLAKHPQIVQDGLQEGLTGIRDVVAGEAQDRAPTDRGTLGLSLYPNHHSTLTETKRNKAFVGSKLPYAAPQEYGTKPFWPPSQPLVEWAMRKGMTAGVGYAVQQSIAKHGIKEKRFLRDGLDEGMKQAKNIMEKSAENILERLGLK